MKYYIGWVFKRLAVSFSRLSLILELAHRVVVSVDVGAQRVNLLLHHRVSILLILQHHLHQEQLALH